MKKHNYEVSIVEQRYKNILKANDLIQKARNNLGILQLKVLGYILSKVTREDKPGQIYTFDIKEFCKVCDIDPTSGKNKGDIKAALQSLRDKSFWIVDENGKDALVAWIEKPKIDSKNSLVELRLDEDVQKYLLGWLEKYTQYSLSEVIPMKSRYSFVLFELLMSYAYKHMQEFDIDDLKSKIGATNYKNFKDFRIKVLDVAMNEINLHTNLEASWEPVTKGKKVIKVRFFMERYEEGMKPLNSKSSIA